MQFNNKKFHGIGMQINNGSVIGNQGVVFTSSSGALVANFSGSNIQVGGLPPAAQLKILACDADGKELESFYLPLTPLLEVSADSIKYISTTSAPVTVRKANSVQQISTTNGDVVVHECESVQSVTTTNGDVTANKIGTAKTANGDVKQRGRSKSPKRSKALVVNNSF
jgi:hypothetical protein